MGSEEGREGEEAMLMRKFTGKRSSALLRRHAAESVCDQTNAVNLYVKSLCH